MKLTLLLLLPLTLFAQSYDVIIRNGHIVDGTGSPWYAADIAIRDGHIAAIGRLDSATAKQTIDAAGMVVAPGFIDMLGQSEESILVNPHLPSKIYQGITTEITGEGGSAAPLTDAIRAADRADYEHYKIDPIVEHLPRVFRAPAKNRAWGSIWRVTSARRRCAAP